MIARKRTRPVAVQTGMFRFAAIVALATVASAPLAAAAATIDVRVENSRGAAVPEAIVYAVREGRHFQVARPTAIMDQRDRTFVPHVLVVQTGTAVMFPNSDDVGHHVYSFSRAKSFELPLYKGKPSKAIVFDKTGVATLGCNIHDRMNAFIVVVDTPFFDKTDADGRVSLSDLTPGRYTLHLWYEDMRREVPPTTVVLGPDELLDVTLSTTTGGLATPTATR